jgi:Raf kinase inhibitor-like YbhB/YbcL family protein
MATARKSPWPFFHFERTLRSTMPSNLVVVGLVVGLASVCGCSPGGKPPLTTGTAGATGTAGTTGAGGDTSGAAGATGAAGTTGSAGTTGAAGNTGTAGTTSTAGASGTAGAGDTAGTSGAAGAGGTAGAGGAGASFTLTSSAFTEGMEIPLKHKCALVNPVGMNQSPPLAWTRNPTGVASYAVTLVDVAHGALHWAIWDIQAGTTALPENVDHVAMPPVPAGAIQAVEGLDGFTGVGYLGPCPQAVNAPQMYRFTVWAFNSATLLLPSRSGPSYVLTTIENAAIASATLMGTQIQTP